MEKPKPPFNYEIGNRIAASGGFSEVRAFENNEKYLVKRLFKAYDPERAAELPIGDFDSSRQIRPENAAIEAGKDLALIKKYLGAYIPPTKVVLGPDESGKTAVYIVQERIHAGTTRYAPESLRQCEEELDDIYSGALQMFLSTYDGSLDVGRIPDLRSANIFFLPAKVSGKKIRLVDTYPVLWGPAELIAAYLEAHRLDHCMEENFHLPKTEALLVELESLAKAKKNITTA